MKLSTILCRDCNTSKKLGVWDENIGIKSLFGTTPILCIWDFTNLMSLCKSCLHDFGLWTILFDQNFHLNKWLYRGLVLIDILSQYLFVLYLIIILLDTHVTFFNDVWLNLNTQSFSWTFHKPFSCPRSLICLGYDHMSKFKF